MMKNKTIPSIDYKYWLKRLDNKQSMNQPTKIKVFKVVKRTNKKTLKTNVINSPLSSTSLAVTTRKL